jgi:hypothetical protein
MFAIVLASCLCSQFGGGVNRVAGVVDPTTGLPRFAIRDANGGLVSAGAFVASEPSTKAVVSTKSKAVVKAKTTPKRGKPKSANERIAAKREFMSAALIGL